MFEVADHFFLSPSVEVPVGPLLAFRLYAFCESMAQHHTSYKHHLQEMKVFQEEETPQEKMAELL